jgi:hypothetical protein
MNPHSDRVAFVLFGEASLVAVQVGMLHALYKRAIVPHLIAARRTHIPRRRRRHATADPIEHASARTAAR